MNESSERRSAGRSIRDALRNACGYTEPECGELKMIGARHSAGSTISNGGDSSPSNWVIVGRRPWDPLLWAQSLLPEKRRFLCGLIVGNHNPYAKRKKVCSRLERILSAKKA